MATTGLLSGIGALVLSIVGVVFTVSAVREFEDFMEPGPYDASVVSCSVGPGAIDVEAAVTNQSDERRDYTVYGVVNQPHGIADRALTVFVDVFLLLPVLPLLILLAAYLPPGVTSLTIVLCITSWAFQARQLRSQGLSIRNRDFLLAARALGQGYRRAGNREDGDRRGCGNRDRESAGKDQSSC